MVVLDFRNWKIDDFGFLPNAKNQLLKKDFDEITKITDLEVLDLGRIVPFELSSLFFEDKNTVAISPVLNISNYYSVIDSILEVKGKEVIDYTEAAEEEVFFYGSNSLVFHSNTEIAICGINEKSDESLFEEYCEDFELTPFSFDLEDNLLTSDIALFLGNTLLICLELIKDKKLKKSLFSVLKKQSIQIVSITKEQVINGVLDIKMVKGKLLATDKSASLLTPEQKNNLPDLEVINLPFLEKAGIRLRDIII